ncbi:hypothetical protein IWW37_003553 [Coemansia sp. RSA 2050]|nr:hypothetical protein IWW37_003553 [Coemansia sp. RSA 2050]KAJ2732962.1 hypothetical protein IW152_003456 [Coemansia sp. BCRC 34962]
MSAIEWRIRVKALMESGAEREFQVDVLSDETVGDFRGRLATTSHVEPQKQRLIYHGRLLVDDAQKLVDVGVSNGSALHMVARPTVAAPNATTPAERANPGARGGTGAFLPGFGSAADQQASQQQPTTTFGLTPLAAQVMSQTFNRLRARDRDAAGIPQPAQEAMQRVIHGVHRDFGADNGGEWIASTANFLRYVIDREAALGSSLTAEEIRRGSVQGAEPLFQGSSIEAYLPIPGLTSNDSQLQRRPEHLPLRAQPSRAQANELLYELHESLLPALRRLPGHENYSYSSVPLSHPRYLGQASTNQVEVVGDALGGLGEALIELGRSLQSVGSQWQSRNSAQPEAAYSLEEMQNIFQALRQLVSATSAASPFLQATLAPTPSEQPAATSRAQSGDASVSVGALIYRSPHQAAVLLSNQRRARRLYSIDAAMDLPRPRPHATLEIEFTMSPVPIALFPPLTNTHDPSQPRPQSQPQPQPQPQPQSQPQPQPRPTGTASIATLLNNAGQQAGTTAHMAAGQVPGTDGGGSFVVPEAFVNLGNLIEQLRSRVDMVFQDSLSGPIAAGTSAQPSSADLESGRSNANVDTGATASNAPGGDAQASIAETYAGFAGFIDRLSSLGSQTARNDRSNVSTTTEYGSVVDAASQAPRFTSTNLGGNGGATNQMWQLMSGLMQSNNPFSIVPIFVGTESGSTANTSRRASVVSNTSAALTSDSGGNAGLAASVPAPPLVFRSRDATASAATGPRTGEVRARSDSISSPGNVGEGASGSSSSSRSMGTSKRHKPDEASHNEDQGSSGGR